MCRSHVTPQVPLRDALLAVPFQALPWMSLIFVVTSPGGFDMACKHINCGAWDVAQLARQVCPGVMVPARCTLHGPLCCCLRFA